MGKHHGTGVMFFVIYAYLGALSWQTCKGEGYILASKHIPKYRRLEEHDCLLGHLRYLHVHIAYMYRVFIISITQHVFVKILLKGYIDRNRSCKRPCTGVF